MNPTQDDYKRAVEALSGYTNLNFVQRILSPSEYPVINNPDGSYSTHRMEWGDDGQGNYFVYPTIVQPKPNGPLQQLDSKQAWEYAMRTGEYIPVKSDKEADWISRNYKSVWVPPGTKFTPTGTNLKPQQ